MKDAKRNERESYETPEVLDIKPVTTCIIEGIHESGLLDGEE